ncbi:MAG: dihydrolipoyl dehydrogenase [Actinobacteria bacterium]|nr:dihydrolipoyl dehydrogenase [Actinomycetota bacterium]
MERYEIAIIGSGPAGYVGAIKAARFGVPTCVIEEASFGGVCLNTGCIPTKAMVASARAIRSAHRAQEFGFRIEGPINVDLNDLTRRKDHIVDIERQGLEKLVQKSGASIIKGRASFIDNNTLRISNAGGDRTIFSKNIIIATGSKSAELPFLPYDGVRVFSGEDILSLDNIPSTMLVIGGGYIGCEYSSLFSTLGTKITIIEALPNLIPGTDNEISAVLEREFRKEGIKIMLDSRITSASVGDNVSVTLADGTVVSADAALVAIGRRPFSSDIGLENIGLSTTPNGAIRVNNQMQTDIPGIYAVGDVIGNPMLAHVASAECKVAVENALGRRFIMDYTVVPSAIYTYPEIGSVGITENQAREMGMDIRVGRVLLRSLGISHAASEIVGVAKIITDAISDAIMGVHIVGERATDTIHEVAVAMFQGLSSSALGRVIHAHPTFSEAIAEASLDIHGETIYVPRRAA